MADASPPPPPPPLHSRITLASAADPKNLVLLRRLNSLLLPINYRENFYRDILTNPSDAALSRVASWDGGLGIVGGIRGRWEPPEGSRTDPLPDDGSRRGGKIYLMTICVLSPYRRVGVATALLADIVETARRWGVDEVYAHVWQENFGALEWYKRRGFVADEGLVEGYYRKLRPDGAKIMRLQVES